MAHFLQWKIFRKLTNKQFLLLKMIRKTSESFFRFSSETFCFLNLRPILIFIIKTHEHTKTALRNRVGALV